MALSSRECLVLSAESGGRTREVEVEARDSASAALGSFASGMSAQYVDMAGCRLLSGERRREHHEKESRRDRSQI